MARKITEKQKTKIWLSTSACYCKALKECYPDILKNADESKFNELNYDRELRKHLAMAGVDERNDEIHRMYMKHVLNLSTSELEAIIEADKQKVIRRAPYTIDEITYELLNRSINPGEKTDEQV